jgi:hypothetical protein
MTAAIGFKQRVEREREREREVEEWVFSRSAQPRDGMEKLALCVWGTVAKGHNAKSKGAQRKCGGEEDRGWGT